VTPSGLAGDRASQAVSAAARPAWAQRGDQDDTRPLCRRTAHRPVLQTFEPNRSDPFARNIRIVQRITSPRRCCEAAGKARVGAWSGTPAESHGSDTALFPTRRGTRTRHVRNRRSARADLHQLFPVACRPTPVEL